MSNLAIIEKVESIAGQPESKIMRAIKLALPQRTPILAPALMRQAAMVLRGSGALQKADEYSVWNSIAEVAQSGLSLDPHLGQCFLVPFSGICTVMYGYKGLAELARRSGEITEIVGEVRYSKDKWSLTLGTERRLVHVPLDAPISKRGEALGAYAVAELLHGKPVFEYMAAEEILAIKKAVLARNKSGKPSPWELSEWEMWRKTPIRKIAKRLPQSPSIIPFVQASARDEYRDAGLVTQEPVTIEVHQALAAEGIEPHTPEPETEPQKKSARKSEVKEAKPAPDAKISENEVKDIRILQADLHLDGADIKKALKEIGHDGVLNDLPKAKLADLLQKIQQLFGR